MKFQNLFLTILFIFQIQSQRCRCGNRNYNPVCGANGKTYFHPCMMRCDEVQEAYQGVCVGCNCPDVLLPVCGDDGFSYINSCEANCHSAVVVRSSRCPQNCGCNNEPENRVCGINQKTYRNLCQLKCYKIGLLHNGPCLNQQGCNCNRGHIDPLCDISGKLYQNACFARCNHAIIDPKGRCLDGTRYGNPTGNTYWHYHQIIYLHIKQQCNFTIYCLIESLMLMSIKQQLMNNQNPNDDITNQIRGLFGNIVRKVSNVSQQAIEKLQDPNFQENVKNKVSNAYQFSKEVYQKEDSLNLLIYQRKQNSIRYRQKYKIGIQYKS